MASQRSAWALKDGYPASVHSPGCASRTNRSAHATATSAWDSVPNQNGPPAALRSFSRSSSVAVISGSAAIGPNGATEAVAAKNALVKKADGLVGEPGRQGTDAEPGASYGPAPRKKPALVGCDLVEGVENGPALDEHFSVVQDEDRHAPQRVELGHFLGLRPDRPRPMLVDEPVVVEGDRDSSHERRVELADEKHGLFR